MRQIYADNSATTKLSPVVLEKMMPYLTEVYGNPSSLYRIGGRAKEAVEAARENIARNLGAKRPSEIYFTSGGSESDNWALKGAAHALRSKGKNHIITSKFEHHAILHTCEALEKEGFEVTYLDVYENGIVHPEDVESAIKDTTAIVSIMYANNEIGTIQPIPEIGEILRQGVKLENLIEGGAQERGRRAGTENVAGIVGLDAALQLAVDTMDERCAKLSVLRDRLIDELLKIERSRINGDRVKRLPNNVNMCFEGIEGESLLLKLDLNGVSASSGSACTSGSLDPSHVLLSIGLPHEIAHGSTRMTFSEDTTEEDIDYIAKIVPEIVSYLRGMSPLWEKIKLEERLGK